MGRNKLSNMYEVDRANEERKLTEKPEGFSCLGCGNYTRYSVFVLTHWDFPLVATCSECGQKHGLRMGHVWKSVTTAT